MKTLILLLFISLNLSAQTRITNRLLPDTTIANQKTVILIDITGKSITIDSCDYIFMLSCNFTSDSIPVKISNAKSVNIYNTNTYQSGKYNNNNSYDFTNIAKVTIDGGGNSAHYERDAIADNKAYEDIINELKALFATGKYYVPKPLRNIINAKTN